MCVAGGCVALAVLIVFAGTLHHGFLWDDEQFVLKNHFLTSARFLPQLLTQNIVAGAGLVSNLYRPLQSLTHVLDVRLWGYQPWGHHLTNVLLHAAAAVAVFRLLATLCPVWPAACAALLFALHPLQSEAVAYVSGRGDTLAMLWLCLGLLALGRSTWLALGCAALGMASKESLALFPLFALLYDYARGERIAWRRHWPLWLLSGAYVVLRLTVFNFNNTLNFYSQPNILTEQPLCRLYTYLTTIPKGLLLWLWPADLHHERSWAVFVNPALPQVWGGALAAAGLLVLAWRCRRRRPVVAAGILWWFAATLPTSNLVVLINALFYDHWFLLPGFGLIMITGAMVSAGWEDRRAWLRRSVAAGTVLVLAACALLTWRYNRVWRDPASLYAYILRWEPRSAKMHNNLGMAYADAGRWEDAVRAYRAAIALSDEYPQTHHNLGNVLLQRGEQVAAAAEFRRTVTMRPDFYQSWMALGALALQGRRFIEAEEAFAAAVRAYPYEPHAYLGLAQARLAQGNTPEALHAIQDGLHTAPGSASLQEALRELNPLRK